MVALAEIDLASAQNAAEELLQQGFPALAIQVDITREAEVQSAVSRVMERFGRVDILVNNAGKNFNYDATTMSEADWDNAMNVDVKGAWLCCKYVLPSMIAANAGSIINIASVHARITAPKHFPYAAAKSALVGLTRNLALDYAPYNIRVNAVCPGIIDTSRMDDVPRGDPWNQMVSNNVPLGRAGTGEDIARNCVYLCSDQGSWVSGQSWNVDGGHMTAH